MQQTLFIVILAVVIALALAYRWKKKTENKMGNDLNALIEANDWCGVSYSTQATDYLGSLACVVYSIVNCSNCE